MPRELQEGRGGCVRAVRRLQRHWLAGGCAAHQQPHPSLRRLGLGKCVYSFIKIHTIYMLYCIYLCMNLDIKMYLVIYGYIYSMT